MVSSSVDEMEEPVERQEQYQGHSNEIIKDTKDVSGAESGDEESFYDCTPLEDDVKNVPDAASSQQERTDDNGKLPSKTYERLMRSRLCAFCLNRFPRTCTVFFAVILPLWVLIFFSLLFGAVMCEYEAPPEIQENDMTLARIYFAQFSRNTVVEIATALPRICLILYMAKEKLTNETESLIGTDAARFIQPLLQDTIGSTYGNWDPPSLMFPSGSYNEPRHFTKKFDSEVVFDPERIDAKSSELYKFMSGCGESGENAIKFLLDHFSGMSESLTFNWIRCFEGAESGRRNFFGGYLTAEQRSSSGQTEVYSVAWEDDRKQLYGIYYNSLISEGVDPVTAYRNATVMAAHDATGQSVCELNAPAAAWFWFTVQTTVGYGNAPPTTTESRILVYTVGFISIIAFGGILGTAGYILSYLFDNYSERNDMALLSKPWFGCLLWGSIYYLWMFLIAYLIDQWKQRRLNIDFPMDDGYWFAYISTTTVGLGDFYLEPEGITGTDLFVFSIVFLTGFMYLAAFLGKVVELITSTFQRGRKSLIDSLLENHVSWSEAFAKEDSL